MTPLAVWAPAGTKVTDVKKSVERALQKSKDGVLPNSVEAGAPIIFVQYLAKDVKDRLVRTTCPLRTCCQPRARARVAGWQTHACVGLASNLTWL